MGIKNDTVNDTIASFTVSVMVAEAGLEAASPNLLCGKKCVWPPLLPKYGLIFFNKPTFHHCAFSRKGKNKGKFSQQVYYYETIWGYKIIIYALEINGDISLASLQQKYNLFRRIILVILVHLNYLFQVLIAVM